MSEESWPSAADKYCAEAMRSWRCESNCLLGETDAVAQVIQTGVLVGEFSCALKENNAHRNHEHYGGDKQAVHGVEFWFR